MPKLVGQIPQTRRVITGLNSLDRAFNVDQKRLGIPVGCGYEFFGFTHTGKSTFTYSLASIIALAEKRGWALCDLEGFDLKFVQSIAEFQGMGDEDIIRICDGTTIKGKDIYTATEEMLLDELVKYLKTGEYAVGMLDSVAAISPVSEQEGDVGEANMGRRAKAIVQVTRKMGKVFRQEFAPTFLAVNHYLQKIGEKGYYVPGGEAKNYLFSVRVRLQQLKDERFEDGSYILRGFVEKNRWGGGRDGNQFEVFIQSGMGIHRGLTAVLDCLSLGIVAKGSWVSVGENKFRLKELRESWADPDTYQPFYEALEKYNEENE